MSVLGNTKTKINEVKDILNPFKTMSVRDIHIDGGRIDWVFEFIDEKKLKKETSSMTENDMVEVNNNFDRWIEEPLIRLAYYVCGFFLMNPDKYKVDISPILKNGKNPIPIILNIQQSMYNQMEMYLHVMTPNGSKMIIKYSRI